jgi:hypothetical protein
MRPKDNGALQLSFDRFWVDLGADSLRKDVGGASSADSGGQGCALLRLAALHGAASGGGASA